jgi:hypothetical protein
MSKETYYMSKETLCVKRLSIQVLAVEILSIVLKQSYSRADVEDLVKHLKPVDNNSILEHSPWKEAYFAVRAILPLLIALVFLVVVVLRKVLFFLLFF